MFPLDKDYSAETNQNSAQVEQPVTIVKEAPNLEISKKPDNSTTNSQPTVSNENHVIVDVCNCGFFLKTTTVGEFVADHGFLNFEGFTSFFRNTPFCSHCRETGNKMGNSSSPKRKNRQSVYQLSLFTLGQKYWDQHPSTSQFTSTDQSFRETWSKLEPFWNQSENDFPKDQDQTELFDAFLFDLDYQFTLFGDTMLKFWNERIQKKRAKVPARQVFYDTIKTMVPCPKLIKPVTWFYTKNHTEVRSLLEQKWLEHHFQPKVQDVICSRQKREQSFREVTTNFYNGPIRYTDSWNRPPGINEILQNKAVEKYYTFKCGSAIFPINYRKDYDQSFFDRNRIQDGSILNPPFSEPLLDKIVEALIHRTIAEKTVLPTILPYKTQKAWYKILEAFKVPIILLKHPIIYLRGKRLRYIGISPFQTCIAMIGAVTQGAIITVNNDSLGYPLDLNYIRDFREINFPHRIQALHGIVTTQGFSTQMNILHTIGEIATTAESLSEGENLSEKFDFQTMKIYNHLLQNVENEIDALNSHLWAHQLNPWIKAHVLWSKIRDKDRQLITKREAGPLLHSFGSEPRQKYSKTRCRVCKGLGHTPQMCPSKIHSIPELGLGSLSEKYLYNYIRKTFREGNSSKRKFSISLTDPHLFWTQSKKILHVEAKFWRDWEKYATDRGLDDPFVVLKDLEFSKGRKALGFNFAMGAPLAELILDAFGAVLHLVDPPPACEFVDKIGDTGEPVYPTLDPQILKEDEVELKRRTQYIVPKQYIQYILPRFVVVNNDKTQRSINDCRLLGPYTARNRFRLDTPSTLRNFAPDDIILSIDGKSAYKQRKLCWASRRQIGFRTIIDGKVCYVALATPPFGLHNAGHIYQKCLEAKLHRVSGGLFWIEYIDDVVIKLGSRHLNKAQLHWVGSAFLWMLTKAGEIMNNKFHVYQEVVTMLGMKYNLDTDRFIPKLDSLYKFGTLMAKVLQAPQISLGQIEKICGRVNWICGTQAKEALQPLYQFIGETKRKRDPHNRLPHTVLQSAKVDMNVRIHESILDILALLIKQYTEFGEPHISDQSEVLYIVVDTNPTIAGGYMLFRHVTYDFCEFTVPVDQMALKIHQVPLKYIKDHKYDKILHSYKNECTGLLSYITNNYKKIQSLAQQASNIVVVGDNLGLISNLSSKTNKNFINFTEQSKVHSMLAALEVPYHFTWLRRSTSTISYADQLGRPQDFGIKTYLHHQLERFFKSSIYQPELFNISTSIPRFLPGFVVDKYLNKPGLPLILIPLSAEVVKIQQILCTISNLHKDFLVGTPKKKIRSWKAYMEGSKVFKVKAITSELFISSTLSAKPSTNMPYLFFKLKLGIPSRFKL